MEKILSISIASYNVEEFLEKTVGSLTEEEETLRKLEVFLVNDGSTDRTSEIAHQLAEKYPESIIVIDKENGGYGSTVNASLQRAEGKYYKLLDGDDRFEPSTLGDFVEFLERADADLIVSPFYKVTDQKILTDSHPEIGRKTEKLSELRLSDPVFQMHELAIRPEILRNLDCPIAEHCFYTDLEFVFYCLAAAETVARFPQPVYCYRLGVDGQSVSLAGIRKHYRELMTVTERVCCQFTERDIGSRTEKRELMADALSNIFFQTCRGWLLLEKPKKQQKVLIQKDQLLKTKYPEAYALGGGSKLVKTLRALHFRLYDLMALYSLRKFQRENRR